MDPRRMSRRELLAALGAVAGFSLLPGDSRQRPKGNAGAAGDAGTAGPADLASGSADMASPGYGRAQLTREQAPYFLTERPSLDGVPDPDLSFLERFAKYGYSRMDALTSGMETFMDDSVPVTAFIPDELPRYLDDVAMDATFRRFPGADIIVPSQTRSRMRVVTDTDFGAAYSRYCAWAIAFLLNQEGMDHIAWPAVNWGIGPSGESAAGVGGIPGHVGQFYGIEYAVGMDVTRADQTRVQAQTIVIDPASGGHYYGGIPCVEGSAVTYDFSHAYIFAGTTARPEVALGAPFSEALPFALCKAYERFYEQRGLAPRQMVESQQELGLYAEALEESISAVMVDRVASRFGLSVDIEANITRMGAMGQYRLLPMFHDHVLKDGLAKTLRWVRDDPSS
ncbi:hypothetical protein COV94_04730, partial [Candidatus Woesearchaeota archaeon CG11_big_fil_rev_8_21_14_0_20_57_5]